ncbi:hypothetical protein LguiA_026498 [Lonicera macranthoides]
MDVEKTTAEQPASEKQSKTYQKVKRIKKPHHAEEEDVGKICFSEEGFQEVDYPRNDALVVTLMIANYMVERILIDHGSSVENIHPRSDSAPRMSNNSNILPGEDQIFTIRYSDCALLDSSFINEIIREIQYKLKKDGSKVLPVPVDIYLDREVDIEKIEGAGDAVGLQQNQEGEGLSSKETLENPSFHESIKSFLQCIPNMKDIPPKDRYPSGVLDLSNRSIKFLPKTISSLVELRELWLRGDRLLAELPSEIGALKNLKVLDLEGTELICLPKEIEELHQLECLKVSLYRCADNYIKETGAIIPRGALSKLSCLKELSINVDPDCKWWKEVAEAIITELPKLENLKILKFYFPEDELLQQFLQHAGNVFRSLSNFRLIVGHHEADIVFRLPNELQSEFEKSEKCLKYVNGVGKTDGIGKALEHAKAFFLDRHWDIKKLSEFNIHNMHLLVCCLVLECNEMETIIDGSDFYQEGDNNNIDKEPVLKLLRYLSVHHMKKLQCIWKGPFVTGCFFSLEILVLHTCPELITVFNPELLRNLRNLKELIVKSCPKIQSLVTVEPHPLQSDDNFLPNLQNILLLHLPGLLSISSGLIIRPNLQKIIVYNCPKLTPEDKYSKYIDKINHDSKWSKALDSSNNETDYLRSILEDQLKNSENSRQVLTPTNMEWIDQLPLCPSVGWLESERRQLPIQFITQTTINSKGVAFFQISDSIPGSRTV